MRKKLKIISTVLIILSASLMLFGCSNATTASKASTSATSAAAQKDLKELVLVELPGEDTPELATARTNYVEDMSKAIGIPVKRFKATDYTAAIEAMRTGNAQMASFGPFSYVSAIDRAGAQALVTTSKDGLEGYYSYIITKKDSPINSIAELRGKTFAFVDPQSTSGNVVPSDQILLNINDPKLTFDDLHVNAKFFKAVTFAGSHPNSLQAVFKGDVDAGAVASTTWVTEANAKHFDPDQIKIIFKSPLIPSSPIAVQKDLPQDLKDKIKNFLINYHNQDYWKALGQKDGQKWSYVAVDDAFYKYVKDLQVKYNLKD